MQSYRPNTIMPPAVKALIIANVAVYFLTMVIDRRWGLYTTANILGLHLPQSEYWQPWQYITHMFMHGSITHIFFNMFAVFMFGRILETVWGSKRFLVFYFATGIGAALLNSLIGWYEINEMLKQFEAFKNTPEPGLLSDFVRDHLARPTEAVWEIVDGWTNNPNSPAWIQQGEMLFQQIIHLEINIPMIGASGAVFGILVAFGMLFPNTELFLMFIPIPIKAKYFVMGYGLIELFLGIQNSASDNVAHFAHLGGMLFGFILVSFWKKNRNRFY